MKFARVTIIFTFQKSMHINIIYSVPSISVHIETAEDDEICIRIRILIDIGATIDTGNL